MKTNENFDINKFIYPDVSCAPVYIWVWNDICTREIIDEQLGEMQRLGIRAFYILPEPKDFRPDSMPTSLSPDYLSEEYFVLCAYAIDKGSSLGMNCWIYDEGGWPSGSACGKVVKDHPEYSLGSNYPDLLNKKSTEYFIEITHEKYASAIKKFTAVFTDEPKAPLNPFNKELADKYEKIYGESVLPHLSLIENQEMPTEENVRILRRWFDLCSRTFCENYLLPCKKWANENGFAFTGHLDKDHSPDGCMNGGGNFNLMRALRCFDIPGIDVIWRQIYPTNKVATKDDMNAYNGFYPRYASSAAAHNGTKLALSEVFGVAGPGLTYDMMIYTVGYQAVRGINVFNPFNFPLGRKGQLLAQELPVFTEKQPYCRFLGEFNRYTERLSYVSSLGKRVCETALYYPVSDFQGRLNAETVSKEFDFLGRKLEDMTADFDIVDDDVIQTAEITENGRMLIGSAEYKHIIIPCCAYLPDKTKNSLDKFIKHGGRVSYGLSDVNPVIEADGKGLRAMHRITESSKIFILFNETEENGKYSVHLPSANGYLLDLMNGTLQNLQTENGVLNLSLAIGETAVVLLTDEIYVSENPKEYKTEFDISDGFVFRKETELICNENGFDNINHSDKSAPISLGDWSCLIGSAYSGSGIYETTFRLPDEKAGKEGIISLGDVRFSASVFLNEHYLGTVLAPPYRLKIPEGLLGSENKLKIVVTNTSANWYLHTDYFDKWSIKELSPYFETELDYAKDSVSGGLYGPVVLYTE
ncbi:MAG: beta galactosidase jelly roll domain-containing protein [Clostridia bacterium]|nr:beta galactosidase jelly roll domain-containing protein [Clostridia bacterium]